jgi:hypothetical protein
MVDGDGIFTKLRVKDKTGAFISKEELEIEVEARMNESDKDPMWVCKIRFAEDGIHHEIYWDGKFAGRKIQSYSTFEGVLDSNFCTIAGDFI